MDKVYLENTMIAMANTHRPGECLGEHCTLHKRSEHSMRSFPQNWRNDRGMMERVCSHGIGHPDPDDYRLTVSKYYGLHGCDGCCTDD